MPGLNKRRPGRRRLFRIGKELDRKLRVVIGASVFLVLGLMWWGATASGLVQPLFLPAPGTVWQRMLALARQGIGVTVFEVAEKLQETGAGIQLSPNATQVLLELGLAERLKPAIVEPTAIRLRSGPSGRGGRSCGV